MMRNEGGNSQARILGMIVLAAILGLSLLTGCGGKHRELRKASIDLGDKQLYDYGLAKMAKKKWLEARSVFRQLELRNPRGDLAPLVKLSIADTYWNEKSVGSRAEAVAAYRSFLSFYPKHPKACYAQFQLARYHMKHMESPERDQSDTHNAIRELQKLLVNYPDCELSEEARGSLDACFNRLADHELKVADYYFKLHKDQAALGRYNYILKNYYKYPRRDYVMYRLIVLYKRVEESEKMEEVRKNLLENYPNSEYAYKAKGQNPPDEIKKEKKEKEKEAKRAKKEKKKQEKEKEQEEKSK
ncbi:outer membrane protein assembly factor BamD [Acidobacteriota bacterium]